ncbi:hypothetical protein P40081_14935 [Paenibacillus sp. FSL P4-0081]|uniref:hypothetical protein n=1 Tax=Paenibacillus sp. FSL P4-0081 TaxID=1536769 RepID=UPI0004F5A46B|nr:hypothetical protein [Paenibacillus sp. FSL P4-0081]AIQ29303.1 hypothetical protein P40081_14935 [Paenibacillus sp. FSL P4-0081]
MVLSILDSMENVFNTNDELLRSQASIPIYYLLFRGQKEKINDLNLVGRKFFLDFKNAIEENRKAASENISDADFDLLEYDRLSQQGTNDALSIKERYRIIEDYFNKYLRIKNY